MLKDFFQKAWEGHFALGAFNIDSLETLRAVCLGSKNLNAPVIVEVSPGEEKSLGLANFASIVASLNGEFGTQMFLNIDHADDLEVVKKAIDLGFDMVHFDGSKLPLEENVRLTKEIVEEAHNKGIFVEGEMNHIPINNEQYAMTNGQEAKEFAERTGVDIFAVSIGNKHGVYTDGSEKLNLEKLEEIRAVLPETLFSLHGGSGIEGEEIRGALQYGIVKININTELRLAFRETLENMLKGNPEELAWYKLTGPVVEAVRGVVEGKIKLFGTKGLG